MQLASSDAAPHAVLMMTDRRHFADTVCMGTDPGKSILDSSDFLIRAGVVKFCRFCYDGGTNRGVFHANMEPNFIHSIAFSCAFQLSRPDLRRRKSGLRGEAAGHHV